MTCHRRVLISHPKGPLSGDLPAEDGFPSFAARAERLHGALYPVARLEIHMAEIARSSSRQRLFC